MFNYFRKELDWGGRKLVLETGKIARQADGAVVASYGDTIVLCTAVGVRGVKRGRQDPRGFLQARGTSDREGSAGQPSDRPPDPSAVPGWVPQRGPGDRDR